MNGVLKIALLALLAAAGTAVFADALPSAVYRSKIRVSGGAITGSKQFAQILSLTPEGMPWVGEAITELESACGVTLAEAAPEALIFVDFDAPEYAYAVIRFARDLKSVAVVAAASHPELFAAEGDNTFVLKRWSGRDGRLVAIFVEPDLAVVGMEFTARRQSGKSAGYEMPQIATGKAVTFDLALPEKSPRLLCGVKKVSGSLAFAPDGVRASSAWVGGDLRQMQGVIEGLYGVGVVLCFAGDQALLDAARKCLKVKRSADLRAEVFIPDDLWRAAIEALRRKFADDSLTLNFDEEEGW